MGFKPVDLCFGVAIYDRGVHMTLLRLLQGQMKVKYQNSNDIFFLTLDSENAKNLTSECAFRNPGSGIVISDTKYIEVN